MIFTLISTISATDNLTTSTNSATNNLTTSDMDTGPTTSIHNVYSNSTNDEIQAIFDSCLDGDTIQFEDSSYNNLSIVVDKKLNIISTKNSLINSGSISNKAKSMGIDESFAFYFTNLSSNSLIKGLTFKGSSDYLIEVQGANNISIVNNSFSGGKKSVILINNSNRNTIINNTIKSSYNGIYFNNVNRSLISKNKISYNKNIGLNLNNVSINNITNNSISKNGADGVLLANAKTNRLYYNNITDNAISGLRLEGSTTRNQIQYNNISANVMNIYANSLTNGDVISYNTLMFAKRSENWYYTTGDNLGAAIVFSDDFKASPAGTMYFGMNSVGFNDVWDAKSTMTHPPVEIAPNWYFDNDGNYGLGHICPMVFGGALDPENFKHLSMGFSSDGKGIIGQLFNGNSASGAGAFTIDNINVDGKDYGSVEVGTDGSFSIDSGTIPAGSNITVTINGHSFTISNEEDIVVEEETNGSSNNPQYKDERKKTSEGNNEPITGNGTGSGTGSSTGTGSGEGNFTGSGISVGTLSGESNSGTGDNGENGGGSASEGGLTAYKLEKQISGTAAKNSQLIAVFAVFFVILIVALGYRSKNKNDNLDDYELK
ncbi:MAG: right-handed parallel beta-helix repeat-containing protein [Methanobrevibacter sp.]|nr:right-handed parallel beta-helix repeat-containing protein [Methanobrevibacter sp.]